MRERGREIEREREREKKGEREREDYKNGSFNSTLSELKKLAFF